ncbi:UDP-xylose and UDP-N-acetylglucosamine transporter [Leucoagaricus sp. SymC.cos]|nr:UDP-xylose and UDP-N-acetylglucosamine transporter [Leucoagaricus sp. SymC.cos]
MPMSVHIIFRSGGLVVSMILGWLVSGKKYNFTQIISVLLVTIGVILTTFSATPSATSNKVSASSVDSWNYITGIAILSLALIFAGLLGLVQDWTYTTYGRPQPSTTKSLADSNSQPPQWQESLFYLHFLSLPMFIFLRKDIQTQVNLVSTQDQTDTLEISFHIPYAFVPLLLNTITQLLCASGVHRLTTRVSSLTVTLILVVRKAISLLLSVLGAGIIPGVGGGKARMVDHRMMWSGAALVLVGTVLYSIGTGKKRTAVETEKKAKKE